MQNGSLKIYKFDYGNLFNKFLCYLIQFMANFTVIIISVVIYFILIQSIMDNADNSIILKILHIALTVLLILTVLFFSCFTFFPRKIIVNNSYIKIQKDAMNFLIGKTWFSSIIPYSSITECSIYDQEITYGRYSFLRQQTYPCTFFNRNSLVKITDKYGDKYYLPIKNADEFVKTINEKIS